MIPSDPRLPIPNPSTQGLTQRLYELWRDLALSLANGLMWSIASTTAPTTGNWSVGDMVRNTSPSELGSGGSKYVIIGWVCVTSGTPGTWKEMRTLTGA